MMNTNLVINTSKIRGYKNKLYAVSLILILTVSMAMAFAPIASAQRGIPQPIQSYAYIDVSPRVIGVGQQATVNLWVAPTPTAYSTAPFYNPATAGGGQEGITVTFTRPDGTKDTFTPTHGVVTFGGADYPAGVVDALGSMYFYYTPSMAGNWSVTMSMPPQNFTDVTGTVLLTEATSAPAYFTVTTEQQNAGLLNGWPWSPLPNDNTYWNYPISANNREWSSIAAPMWPVASGGSWQPYGSGPSTPHILWQLQGGNGGIIGGDTGTLTLTGAGSSPIILLGKAYINNVNGRGGSNCYDLATGKLLWESNNTVTRAMIQPGNVYSQATSRTLETGTVLASSAAPSALLFGTSTGPTIKGKATQNWNYINPLTGLITTQLTNATMGTGTMTNYNSLVFGNVLTTGNPNPPYNAIENYVWGWNRSKVTGNDWYTGLMWTQNVSRHWGGVDQYGPGDGSGRTAFYLSADMSTCAVGGGAGDVEIKGFSTTDGHSVWNVSLDYVSLYSVNVFGTNNFVTFDRSQGTWRCYSTITGALLWKASNVGYLPWATQELRITNDANNLYIADPTGTIVALSIATGKEVWRTELFPSTEEIMNNLPAYTAPVVVDGLVYAFLGYTTSYLILPVPRFSVMACYNATTGATIWTLNGGPMPGAVANGYLFSTSYFDGMINCYGKGQTSTSVSVQNDIVSLGANVLVKGNVLDQSPAQPGTPAVSYASMSEWMDYLHMQNATLLNSPPTPTGVPVTLSVVDSNNNCYDIGTTTTDGAGNYYYDWTPEIEGKYTITAAFAGSGSYWPSSSETGIVVNAAATTPHPTTATSTSVADMYFVPAIAGLFVLIIIVLALVVLLMLRKRP